MKIVNGKLRAEKPLPPKKAVKEALPDLPFGGGGPTSHGWHRIESFFRCPKEYQFKEVRRIYTPQTELPDYFSIGILMHVAKGLWFSKRFATDEKTMEVIHGEVHKAAMKNDPPIRSPAVQQTLTYFAEYVEHYKVRPLPQPIAAEYYVEGRVGAHKRTARLDDVSRYPEAGGKLCIGEAKTTSTSIPDTTLQYTMHGQPMLQMALWDVAPQGRAMHGDIAGVMLDIIVKGYGGKRSKFGRVFIPKPSEHAMSWYRTNMQASLEAADRIGWDTEVPRNISACTRTVGRARVQCPYFKLCQYGKAATTGYVFGEGRSLLDKPFWAGVRGPWE